MLYRAFLRVVDLLPMPSLRTQRLIAAAVILTQGGIAVTGAVVRVTASGLGCPTWPQCFPGSFTPVAVAEVPRIHQAVEFGNRMISFLVVITAALAVLAVTRARRRREVLVYAWLMPASTVLQAIIGGITVRTGLLWWTVAIHLLVSMGMVWLATLLYVKVGEPDVVSDLPSVPPPPAPLSRLTALIGVTLAAVLVAGTLVTGAGPHAGDKSITRVVPRLQVEITTLVHLHGTLLIAYLALLLGLGFGLAAVGVTRHIWVRFTAVLALTLAQALVGVVQFYTGVPAVLVALHVAGAAACTAATAALWAALTTPELAATALPKRAEAQPL
ncbi:COX15/CtaA family protein [Mycobacteroides abscessus]|uniref:Cytochrome oxidase assembly family protein n=8 Tax=Mycobacteroides abscessus TaxID=36809 RepID=A0A829PR47_9MYCO|nr:COX15/CtaA family protein [Mycobacteroides abscessus]ESV59470.1 cytochrome oxidase assembly family protein [Mycobacteroides abscessus MAB_082312_2258]ESV63903.1 cytochrome oxidase assembly family protein [Mycobacteroides abscessus MAB_091912_2446]ETZ89770.1 cytochrome oxidase assembly family protein [Mycobacteroides abscessus MAB_030201_1075]ETZ91517.1 cytochrome oxidase assembly family protein [Mycobacteroides abscessus MAB_030201_1061]EUA47970.1 cytochrome oxidase assembly family protein 